MLAAGASAAPVMDNPLPLKSSHGSRERPFLGSCLGLEGSYPAARGPSPEVEGILVTSLPLLLETPVASVSGAPHRPGLPGKPLSHDPLLPEFVFISSPRGLSP